MVLLLLALAVRLAVIVAPARDLLVLDQPDRRNDFCDEEVHRANVAAELLDGPLLPGWLDYQYVDFFGGSTVVSMVAVPFMAAFGRSFFALKLAPILFHLVATGFAYALLRRAFGPGAAWRGGLLMVITPPAWTALSTVAFGSHVESIGLMMLSAWLFARLHGGPGGAARGGAELGRFALGLSLGFSLFFGYQTALFAAALVGMDLLVLGGRGLVRAWIPQLGGAAIGFAPWIVYNARIDWSGYRIYNQTPARLVGTDTWGKTVELVGSGLPGALDPGRRLGLESPWIGGAMLALLGLLSLAATAGAARAWIRQGRAGLPLSAILVGASWLHVLAFLALHGLTRFRVGEHPANVGSFRYAYVLVPAGLVLATAGWRACAARPTGRRALDVALGLVLLPTLLANLALVDTSRVGALHQLEATHDHGLGRWMGYRLLRHPGRFLESIERVPEHYPPERARSVVRGMGDLLAFLELHAELASPDLNLAPGLVTSARARAAAALPEPYAGLIRRGGTPASARGR